MENKFGCDNDRLCIDFKNANPHHRIALSSYTIPFFVWNVVAYPFSVLVDVADIPLIFMDVAVRRVHNSPFNDFIIPLVILPDDHTRSTSKPPRALNPLTSPTFHSSDKAGNKWSSCK